MRVQHNMNALNANRNLGINNTQLGKKSEKLSSGYRVNRAADDAAGLALSEKMRSQIRGLKQASTNAQDGISMIQTAEGALGQRHEILQRARELIVQGSNSGVLDNGSADFTKINDELAELKKEFDRIGTDTEFNKKKLVDGSYNGYLQVGANKQQGIEVSIAATTMSSYTLAADGKANSANLDTIDTEIQAVSAERSKLGAIQNRLEYTVAVDDIAHENLTSAESRIRDVDMAAEMVEYSKYNILLQASQSMLAQANQSTQGVLSLF